MWRKWRPQEIAREIEEMKALGLNVCRSFLFTPDFMPKPTEVDPVMMERLEEFIALCENAGIYTILTFFVGHMSGENWDVPWRGDRDFWSDPWMLEKECLYVQTVAGRFAETDTILAWILTNEITHYAGNTNPASGSHWARTLCKAIREVDSLHPIGLGDGCWETLGQDNGLRASDVTSIVDLFGPHSYPKDNDSLRHSNAPSFAIRMADFGKPVILEEFGCSTAHASCQHQADYYRTTLHTAFLAGAAGALGWCFSDFDLPHQRPYSHHGFELLFGVTRADGTPKPAALELKRFAEIIGKVDLSSYTPESSGAYIVVPSHFDGTKYPFWQVDVQATLGALQEAFTLAKQAHVPVTFFREPVLPEDVESLSVPSFLHDARLLILPNCQALTAPTYEALVQFAEAGGIAYYSYHTDLSVHNFERLFGCEHRLRYGLVDVPADDVEITFIEDFGEIQRGEKLRYRRAGQYRRSSFCPVTPRGARVIAEDSHGHPALLVNPIGKGKIVFCTYPLEYYLLNTPEVHAKDETYRLYHSLASEAGIAPTFTIDDPFVEIGILRGSHDWLVWLVNHSWEPRSCLLSSRHGVLRVEDLESGREGEQQLILAGKEVRVLRAEPTTSPHETLSRAGVSSSRLPTQIPQQPPVT